MESKYAILIKSEDVKYIETCPIILITDTLTRDNDSDQVLVQLKMKSLSRKKIKEVYIAVKCYDIEGAVKSIYKYEFLDLNVDFNEYFGQHTPIYLPDKYTKKVEISVNKIIFSGENYWKNENNHYFKMLPVPEYIENSIPPNLREQYGREINIEKNKYLPIEGTDYWICSCGSYNPLSEDICHQCKNIKANIFKLSKKSYLTNTLKQYNELKSIAKGEKCHIYEQEVIRNNQFMKIGSIAILIIIAFISIKGLIIPEFNYSKAISLFEQEQYADAFELFRALDTYKDSVAKKKEAGKSLTRDNNYDRGIVAYNQEDYLEANKLFLKYPEYKEAAEYIKNAEDGIYKQALDYVDTGDLDTALLYFKSISNYKDSNEKIIEVSNRINFEKAEALYNDKEYFKAIKALKAMSGESEETTQLRDKSLLGQAEVYCSNSDYTNALDTIKSISIISNEVIQLRDSIYFKQADQYYREGNIDESLDLLNLIEEKSEEADSMEKDLLDFKSKYGKWLGKWGYWTTKNTYALLIKPQWENNRLILLFENKNNVAFELYEDNGDKITYHSDSYNVTYYYTLTYVDDSTITGITNSISSDGSSELISEYTLYKKH